MLTHTEEESYKRLRCSLIGPWTAAVLLSVLYSCHVPSFSPEGGEVFGGLFLGSWEPAYEGKVGPFFSSSSICPRTFSAEFVRTTFSNQKTSSSSSSAGDTFSAGWKNVVA